MLKITTLSLLSLIVFTLTIDIDLRLLRVPKTDYWTPDYIKTYVDNDYYYLIPICLGTPGQCFNVLYETNFTHLIMNPNETDETFPYSTEESSTSTETEDKIAPFSFPGSVINDDIEFQLAIYNITFLQGETFKDKRFQMLDGVFGFGRYYTKSNKAFRPDFSLVNALYEKGVIKRRLFGHKYVGEEKYMKLYIGEITDKTYVQRFSAKENYPKCYCSSSSDKLSKTAGAEFGYLWSCEIEEISVTSGELDDKTVKKFKRSYSPVIFSVGSNVISGPLEEAQELIDLLISLSPEESKCKTVTFNGNKINIVCRWTLDVFKFPTIKFNLGTTELTLQAKNLFYKMYDIRGDVYIYKARFEFGPDEKFWTFGQPILREYDMVFDMDEGSVGFWNMEGGGVNKRKLIQNVGAIVCVVVVISIFVGAAIWYFKWKQENSPEAQQDKKLYSKISKMQEIEIN